MAGSWKKEEKEKKEGGDGSVRKGGWSKGRKEGDVSTSALNTIQDQHIIQQRKE